MSARAPISSLILWALVASAGCGSEPARPDAIPPPTADRTSITLTVLDGWTREPVAGARVSYGRDAVTDGAGRVEIVTSNPCVNVVINAPDFLERRTCATSEVTLWPVADSLEREATRAAAFYNDELRAEWWSVPTDVMFAAELLNRADVIRTWTDAADTIRRRTGNRISFAFVPNASEGLIISPAGASPVCSVERHWPLATGGFCLQYTSQYFLDRLNVATDRLTDAGTALRALLVGASIKPHPAPGLLNESRPADELSPFEQRLLHMIGLRRADLVWPDADRVR